MTSQFSFSPDFLTDTSDFLGEFTEVLNLYWRQTLLAFQNFDFTYHGVDYVFQLYHNHTLNWNGDLL